MKESWFKKAVVVSAVTAASLLGGKEAKSQNIDTNKNTIENVESKEPFSVKSINASWDNKNFTFKANIKVNLKSSSSADMLVVRFALYNEKGDFLGSFTELLPCNNAEGEVTYPVENKFDPKSKDLVEKNPSKYIATQFNFEASLVRNQEIKYTSKQASYQIKTPGQQ